VSGAGCLGPRAREELAWIGGDIRLGDVTFRVDRRNGRCAATNVNPVKGERDLDPASSANATVTRTSSSIWSRARAEVAIGDAVEPPERAESPEPSSLMKAATRAALFGNSARFKLATKRR
jgi:GntR family transcriptional regulator/MocR family aminotransferase